MPENTSATPQAPKSDESPVVVTIVERPLLAWWAIVPVIILFVVLWIFGWPNAQHRATSEDYAVSYFVGLMLGGLLIPLALAWIVHRLSRRSTLASTIVFSAMVGFVCLSVIRPSMPTRFPPSVISPPAANNQLTDFAGFQFEVPAKWAVARNDYESTRAKLGLLDPVHRQWVGLLKVDAGEPVERDPEKVAAGYVKNGGEVTPMMLDGVAGLRFRAPERGLAEPSRGVVALKGDELYLIYAAGEHGADILPAFEHVLKTWRWEETP